MKNLILFLAGLLATSNAFGAESNATEIIRVGEQRLRGESTQSVMVMEVKKPGFSRTLKIRSWTVGNEKALVEILDPAKEEGIASLRGGNQMWNYLPKSDQVVRVPTSLMLQSWMGSDFTNDDLMKSSSLVRDYRHRILKVTKQGREKIVVIECKPKPGAPVVWGKILYSARLSDKLPISQRYFDEGGKWVRTLEFGKFKEMDGRVIPTLARVRVADNRQQMTTIHYKKILYDRVIDDAIFDRDFLRRTVENGKNLSQGWSRAPLRGRTQRLATTRKKPNRTVWSSMGGIGAP